VTATVGHSRWLPFPDTGGGLRLYCLPHAGGSAPFYRPVAQALSPRVEVLAVQYPGRQDRRRESLIGTVRELADGVAQAAAEAIDRPFAIFGHSLGATLAYEVGVRLEAAGLVPARVFASGRRAPSTVRDERVHLSDDNGLVAELRRLSGTAQQIFGDEELMRMVLPAIRNDYRAAETYRHAGGPRLSSPITALTGTGDPKATIAEVKAWAAHTDGDFELKTYTGGHFYLLDHAGAVIDLIDRRLREPVGAGR
jgi:surfactin synthase thioesterase subunit